MKEKSSLTIKNYLFLITFAIVLFSVVQNIGTVSNWMKKFVGFFSPVIIGSCIAFVLNVPLSFFENKVFSNMKKAKRLIIRKLTRPLSILCSLILCLGIIALALLVIIPDMTKTITTIANALPTIFSRALAWVESILEKINVAQDRIPNIYIDWDKFLKIIENYFNNDSNHIVGGAFNITASIIGGMMDFIFSIIIAIYILAKKEQIGQFAQKALHRFLPERAEIVVLHISSLTKDAFVNFITGQLMEAVILGALCFLGMVIFAFPYAAVISIIITVTALVPIVGAVVGEAVGVLFISIESPIKALLFLVFVLALQQFEGSVIYPRVVGKSVGLPSILVLSAVLVGGNISGVIGALIGVPVCAVLYALVKLAIDRGKNAKVILESDVLEENENDTEDNDTQDNIKTESLEYHKTKDKIKFSIRKKEKKKND